MSQSPSTQRTSSSFSWNGFQTRSLPKVPSWIEPLGRAGHVAKGVVYGIIGALAFKLAIGAGGEIAGSRDAIREIGEQPFGRFLLGLVAIGLLGYTAWRWLQAGEDTEGEGTDAKGITKRAAYAISGLLYLGLGCFAGSIALGMGGSQSGSSISSTLLDSSWGRVLIGMGGAAVIGAAIYFLYKAWQASFMEKYRLQSMSDAQRKIALYAGRIGISTRGVAFIIIGGFLLMSAIQGTADGEIAGISDALVAAYSTSIDEAAAILEELGYNAEDIGEALSHTFGASAEHVAEVLESLDQGVREITAALQSVYEQTATQVADILRALGFPANDVSQALRDTFGLGAGEAAAIMQGVGYQIDQLGEVLREQFFEPAGRAGEVLVGLGNNAEVVARALQNAYSLGTQELAQTLLGIGFELTSVLEGLIGLPSTLDDAASAVINGIGSTSQQVAQALNSLGVNVNQWASALLSSDVPIGQVGQLLESVAGQSLSQVGSTLRDLGRSAADVAGLLGSRLGITASNIPDLLLDAGFSANEIAGALDVRQLTNMVDAFTRRVTSQITTISGWLTNSGFTGGQIALGYLQNGVASSQEF